MTDYEEMKSSDYLRNLAERLRYVYEIDDYDINRLYEIAQKLKHVED